MLQENGETEIPGGVLLDKTLHGFDDVGRGKAAQGRRRTRQGRLASVGGSWFHVDGTTCLNVLFLIVKCTTIYATDRISSGSCLEQIADIVTAKKPTSGQKNNEEDFR